MGKKMKKYIDGKDFPSQISILGILKLCDDYSLVFQCQTWIPCEETKEKVRNTVLFFAHDFYDARIKIFTGGV